MRKLVIVAILCAAAAPLRSQSVDPVSADSLSRDLPTVTVTEAARSLKSSAPMRVTTALDMQRQGVSDVSDALHRMPGVTLRDYGGAGGLKTVSVRGFGAAHTGVIYDGAPLSDIQTGRIDLARYSIDNVASVSMVVGDNDDIFIPARQCASAATVAITSIAPMDRPEVTVRFRAGSFGLYNPYLKVGTPLGSRAQVNVIGDFTHADNRYPFTLVNGTTSTRERRNNCSLDSGHAEANLLWNINSTNTLSAKAYYYRCDRRLPGPVIFYNSVNHERLDERNAMGQARWQSRLGSRLSLAVLGKFNYASSFYHDENGKYPGGVLDQRYWQREYYLSAALLANLSDHWLMDYSADWAFNNLNSNLPSDILPRRHSLLQSLTTKYHSHHITATARLLASMYFNSAGRGGAAPDARRMSPSASLSWQPAESQLLFLRASYKNIFRMPTFTEAYFYRLGNPDLRPETTDQFNLGVTYTLPSSHLVTAATFAVDGYFNRVRDMIVAVPYNMFLWSMNNLGSANIAGLDITADITLTPVRGHYITLSGAYSLQRAMPRTSRESAEWMKQIAYIPLHSGSASLSYENPWANLSVSLTGVSERFTTNTNIAATRIAPYTELSASLWRTFVLRRHTIDLRFDVHNILNTQYCIVARYPMPGRSFTASVTYRY